VAQSGVMEPGERRRGSAAERLTSHNRGSAYSRDTAAGGLVPVRRRRLLRSGGQLIELA